MNSQVTKDLSEGLLVQFQSSADRIAFLLKATESNKPYPCEFVGDDSLWIPPGKSAEAQRIATGLELQFEAAASPWFEYQQNHQHTLKHSELVTSWKHLMRDIKAEVKTKPAL